MKEKVIIVTPGGSFFTAPFQRAFESLGFECSSFDCRYGFVYSSLFRKIERRFPVLRTIKNFHVNRINRSLIHAVKKYEPKYLFAQKAENIRPETIEQIKILGVITANFYNDFEWSVVSKIAPAYNYFFTQHQALLERLRNDLHLKNSFYMAHAAEPLSDPFTNYEDKYSISFVGTYNPRIYPNREKYLMAIKDLGLNIWGNEAWGRTSLKDCFHGRAIGSQRFEIYRKSKIVIDINWEHFVSDGISVRPFEVAASGACLFVDLIKKDIKDVYKENEEFISFSSPEELRDKIRYYLIHDEERKKIALAGYNRTVAEHTYIHRVQQFLSVINQ